MPAKRFEMPRASSRRHDSAALGSGAPTGRRPRARRRPGRADGGVPPVEAALDRARRPCASAPRGSLRDAGRTVSAPRPKSTNCELERDAELLQELGDEREREAGDDRALDRAGADRHDEHQPHEPEERRVVGGVVRLGVEHREQAAAEPGDAGRQRERDERAGTSGLMPIDARGGLAPAQRVEEPSRSCPRRTRSTRVPAMREHRHTEAGRRRGRRAANSGRGTSSGTGPAAHPVERHEDAVEHQRERERREREVDAAEPQGRDREQRADGRGEHRADDHRQQHRQAPLVHELRGREPADRRERRLAQRDLPGHAR